MNLSDFDFNLPPELIAQNPQKPRDHSRLLVLEKTSGKIKHKHFYDLPDFLQAGDLIVMNNSKVFPARLIGQKKDTGGKVEIFLHQKIAKETKQAEDIKTFWQCMVGGKSVKSELTVTLSPKLEATILTNNNDGTWEVGFNLDEAQMMKEVYKIGRTPLPPYIKRDKTKKKDLINYQTIYANDKKIGSVAAPTAGLHFTPELVEKLKKQGIKFAYITLHVGLGTFAPVKTEDITKHKMHAEWVEVEAETINQINKAKKNGQRIITVGTTSTRTLEALFNSTKTLKLEPKNYSKWVNIFIYPGYNFQAIDGMITNFHLPKSSLIMLVSALAGKENIDKAYQEAIEKKYRFYSYGDAMLII